MCTGIRLISENGAAVYARTLEFAREVQSNIIIIPRNYAFTGTVPSGNAEGLSWKSTYAIVGTNASNVTGIIDGINEKGLAGGLFYFPGYADYQSVTQHSQAIAPWELMTWLLTTCATVAQVKEALPTITVSNTIFGPWNIIPPVHAIVHDQGGSSLVIEYVQGNLTVYDNPLGVVTNAPTFDWHLTNIQNYINLSVINVSKKHLYGFDVNSLGQGSGMLGLPGDFTSPSRFIRAVAFSQSVIDIKNEQESLATAFHILNLFDIPRGIVRQQEDNTVYYEYTQWTSASDLKNKRYYFHTYENRHIRMIDLMSMDLNNNKTMTITMQGEEKIFDISKDLI